MEYHVYILCSKRGGGYETEKHGDKHGEERRRKKGRGQRWREIKTGGERDGERKLLEVSGNWR